MQYCYGHSPQKHNTTKEQSVSLTSHEEQSFWYSLEIKNSPRAVNSRLKANHNFKGRNKHSSDCHTPVSFRLLCKLALRVCLQSLSALPLHSPLSLFGFLFTTHSRRCWEFAFLPWATLLPALHFPSHYSQLVSLWNWKVFWN